MALKVYFLNRVPCNVLHMLHREARLQAALGHGNVVMLYGAFQVGTATSHEASLHPGVQGSIVGHGGYRKGLTWARAVGGVAGVVYSASGCRVLSIRVRLALHDTPRC